MQLNLFSSCSNLCWSCFKDASGNREKIFQDSKSQIVEDLENLIENVKKFDIKRIVVSSFGEPTAHRQYVEIIERLSEYAEEIVTVTNGGPTSKKVFQVLDKLSALSVSLHGEALAHTCTTRNAKSYDAICSFRERIFNQIERDKLKTKVVSSTLLTKELLGVEREYLSLLQPSDRIRPSRLIYPTLLNTVEKYLNSASLIEISLILRRFGEIDAELKKSQEDQYIPECCCDYNNVLSLNLTRYLSNWFVDRCFQCKKKNLCSGLSIDHLTYRDRQNLNDELSFLKNSDLLHKITQESLKIHEKDFIVPCITYEHCALVALRSILMKPYVFSLPIESFFTLRTYQEAREQCKRCKKRCSFQLSAVERFKLLPAVQLRYKTRLMYELLQKRHSILNEHFEYLMQKFKNVLDIDVPDAEKNKLYVDIPI